MHLIKGDYYSAIESYSIAIQYFREQENSEAWFQAAVEDLENLIKVHGQLEGADEIRELLELK